jgi:hypothetical protein
MPAGLTGTRGEGIKRETSRVLIQSEFSCGGKKYSRMLVYFLAAIAVFLFHFAWKNKFIFNKDLLRNYSNSDVPTIKFGFAFPMLGPAGIFKLEREIALKYKKSVRSVLFNTETLMVFRAKDAERILSNSTQHLTKGHLYDLLHPFLKTGLLTSDGDKWRARRRMLTPAFHFNILKEYCEAFKEESDQLVEKIKNTEGKVVDMVPISTQFTLNTVCGRNEKFYLISNRNLTGFLHPQNQLWALSYLIWEMTERFIATTSTRLQRC